MVMGIYKITNSITDKVYIGQSTNIKNRIKNHKTALKGGYHKNNHLQKSFNKYGDDCFTFNIVTIVENQKLLDWFEQYYIHLYDSYRNGYNQTKGGAFYTDKGHPFKNPSVKKKMIEKKCKEYNSTGFYRVSIAHRKDNQIGLSYVYKYRVDGRVHLITDKSILRLKKRVIENDLDWRVLNVRKARETLRVNIDNLKNNPTKLKSNTNLYRVSKAKHDSYKQGFTYVYSFRKNGCLVKRFYSGNLLDLYDIVKSKGLLWGITDFLYELNSINGIQGVLY